MALERLFDISFESSKGKRNLLTTKGEKLVGKSLLVSELLKKLWITKSRNVLFVTTSDRKAQMVKEHLHFFANDYSDCIEYLPDSETLPYDTESPHSGLVSQRASVFKKIFSKDKTLGLVTSVNNLLTRISTDQHWIDSSVTLEAGGYFVGGIKSFVEILESLGYEEKELEIEDTGEFSYRNHVLDICPLGSEEAIRIKFDLDKILSISILNIKTQLSYESLSNIEILPAKEIPTNENAIRKFRLKFRQKFGRGLGIALYEDVVGGHFPSGIEAYLPLFQDETTDVFSILKNKDNEFPYVIFIDDVENEMDAFELSLHQRYKELVELESKMILKPEDVWIPKNEALIMFSETDVFEINNSNEIEKSIALDIKDTNIARRENLQSTLDLLEMWLDLADKIVFCLHSNVREDEVKTIFEMLDCNAKHVQTWDEALTSDSNLSIVNSVVNEGFFLPTEEVLVITEKELFGQPIFAKSVDEIDRINNFQAVQDLVNLNIGDPVVHLKYGVGRFNGLERTEINGVTKEFMTIYYAEKAKVFVQMDQLDLISRYAGQDKDKAPLDTGSIGSKWFKATKSATGNVISLAKDLLNIQAARQAKKGLPFKKPGHSYIKFCKEFPFQETVDQRQAVEDIIIDLQEGRIMDRIICGDVGFGKTEVALKSSSYVVLNGYQVAILAPTTLLAQQHLESFRQRFSSFPNIRIQGLFGSDKQEERRVIKNAASGEVDIIIGTHRLLQPDVKFKNLGLVVIDEEHRFGVKQKEHFRSIRKDINLMSMTATPIPRTLSMSMHGIRDISIIATPPAKRLSIRTFLVHETKPILLEAINRETRRGGQVYYLHNRTETIAAKAEQIQSLFPNLKVRYGHGKMKEEELSSLMADFYRGDFDVLVATTIIETGIDCPNSNTILIETAENFGIAQLHQLRGRVGRSHHQAYCYLMRGQDIISETAEKRLKAMTKATKLGEGFVLANHDLEIRGAGEILGEEQSGQFQKIGFALYLRLLERAIEALKLGLDVNKALDLSRNSIVDINMSAFIEPGFIVNDRARLSYYKRIVSAEKVTEVDSIAIEIDDKYGDIPSITHRFIRLFRNKVLANEKSIRKLMLFEEGGFIGLMDDIPDETAANMLDLVVNDNSTFSIESPHNFKIHKKLTSEEDRFKMINKIISTLSIE